MDVGIDIEVGLGAIEKKKFPAKLNFIAPKGTEENGAVQFKIKADVTLDEEYFVRAGYSANADIVLETERQCAVHQRKLCCNLIKKLKTPYVDVMTGDQEFERKDVELGISDGINVEVISGVTEEDEIKIWNKTKKMMRIPTEEGTKIYCYQNKTLLRQGFFVWILSDK